MSILSSFDDHQRRLVMIISGMLVLALVFFAGAYWVGRSPVGPQLNRLTALNGEILRLNGLAAKLEPDLQLRQVIANVDALIASDIASLEAERADASGTKTLPKDFEDEAVVANAESELESAAQRSALAGAYREILAEQLAKAKELATNIGAKTKQEGLDARLARAISHLDALSAQLENLK